MNSSVITIYETIESGKVAQVKAYSTNKYITMRYNQTAPSIFNVINNLK